MVQINLDVDANAVSGGDFPLLKDGEYSATIVNTETRVSSKGDTYLVIQFDLGGPQIWMNYNLWHATSPKAVEIAKEQLNSLGAALGMQRIGDSEDLIAKRLTVKVETEAGNGDWPAKNKIVGYKSLAAAQSSQPESQPVQNSPQVTTQTEIVAPAAPSTAVWNT